MVTWCLYQSEQKKVWDDFVISSRTPLFFFQRDFMEYHSDRFVDHSLMFYFEGKLVALLPASKKDNQLISHGGLTYGGLIFHAKIRAETVVAIAEQLLVVAKEQGFLNLIYKSIPYIFHQQPAQDDIYALFNVAKAKLIRRDLSSVIKLNQRLGLSKGRKWLIARAKKNNLQVTSSTDWQGFHQLLRTVLEKHDAMPVHSVEELQLLHNQFPQNIELKVVLQDEAIIAAALLFKFKSVVHTQYLAVSELGKDLGALDYLLETSINESTSEGYEYFSFGISTEQNGQYLNTGLLAQKESFGARSVSLDFYEVNLNEG